MGYLFASISTSGGLIGFLDLTLKILSIVSVMLGITVACYTLRLQRAKIRNLTINNNVQTNRESESE